MSVMTKDRTSIGQELEREMAEEKRYAEMEEYESEMELTEVSNHVVGGNAASAYDQLEQMEDGRDSVEKALSVSGVAGNKSLLTDEVDWAKEAEKMDTIDDLFADVVKGDDEEPLKKMQDIIVARKEEALKGQTPEIGSGKAVVDVEKKKDETSAWEEEEDVKKLMEIESILEDCDGMKYRVKFSSKVMGSEWDSYAISFQSTLNAMLRGAGMLVKGGKMRSLRDILSHIHDETKDSLRYTDEYSEYMSVATKELFKEAKLGWKSDDEMMSHSIGKLQFMLDQDHGAKDVNTMGTKKGQDYSSMLGDALSFLFTSIYSIAGDPKDYLDHSILTTSIMVMVKERMEKWLWNVFLQLLNHNYYTAYLMTILGGSMDLEFVLNHFSSEITGLSNANIIQCIGLTNFRGLITNTISIKDSTLVMIRDSIVSQLKKDQLYDGKGPTAMLNTMMKISTTITIICVYLPGRARTNDCFIDPSELEWITLGKNCNLNFSMVWFIATVNVMLFNKKNQHIIQTINENISQSGDKMIIPMIRFSVGVKLWDTALEVLVKMGRSNIKETISMLGSVAYSKVGSTMLNSITDAQSSMKRMDQILTPGQNVSQETKNYQLQAKVEAGKGNVKEGSLVSDDEVKDELNKRSISEKFHQHVLTFIKRDRESFLSSMTSLMEFTDLLEMQSDDNKVTRANGELLTQLKISNSNNVSATTAHNTWDIKFENLTKLVSDLKTEQKKIVTSMDTMGTKLMATNVSETDDYHRKAWSTTRKLMALITSGDSSIGHASTLKSLLTKSELAPSMLDKIGIMHRGLKRLTKETDKDALEADLGL